MDRDRLGRRRHPEQERGLRPLHPVLPDDWSSRAIRVAMSSGDWARFEGLVAEASHRVSTRARVYGEAIARLIHEQSRPAPGPIDWMDRERRKTLRLLREAN